MAERMASDDALLTLLAAWLLVHEIADDWIRDVVDKGRGEDADPLAQLAAKVDDRKDRLKEAVTAEIGAVSAPGETAELKEALAALGRRLESIEARLDGLSGQGSAPG